MANIAQALKAEIVRLSRKEAKAAVMPLKRANAKLKQANAALKERIAGLERTLMQVQAQSRGVAAPIEAAGIGAKARITGKGIRSLRKRLGVSGEELGKLLGVSPQAVYAMENKAGAIRLRKSTRAAVIGIRNLGAREAKARLAELEASAKPAKNRDRGAARKPAKATKKPRKR
jgi:DNA-binding XRE family transcriptional regulator